MDKTEDKADERRNDFKHKIIQEVTASLLEWPENITEINLTSQKITELCESVVFPPNLAILKLSKCNLDSVPKKVSELEKLTVLDVSFNHIQFFNDTPKFCHSLEQLNLANNKLKGPPYWVWSEKPLKLTHLDLSNNLEICSSFVDGYYEAILSLVPSVKYVKMYNCRLNKHFKLLGTFVAAKDLNLGLPGSNYASNCFIEVPFAGIDQCCDLERLSLCNTRVNNILANIDMYDALLEINLSCNCLNLLPNEFCNLKNLQVCILSDNYLMYLPEKFHEMKELKSLQIYNNELCTLPANFVFPKLVKLDLYNNSLYEVPEVIFSVPEIDLAQNYLIEPDDDDYIEKKKKLRLNGGNDVRIDGNKVEFCKSESECLEDVTDDEAMLSRADEQCSDDVGEKEVAPASDSSEEDWDSDDYWMPHPRCVKSYFSTNPEQSWLSFVKKKMADGNFCPMDLHTVPIIDQIKYERQINPKVIHESDGQFDDLSEDDS